MYLYMNIYMKYVETDTDTDKYMNTDTDTDYYWWLGECMTF